MILPIHIIIALASLAYTTYLFLRPSRSRLITSYGLVAGTLVSGTCLVVATKAHLLQACLTGLFYLAGVTLGIVAAQRKLVLQKASINRR